MYTTYLENNVIRTLQRFYYVRYQKDQKLERCNTYTRCIVCENVKRQRYIFKHILIYRQVCFSNYVLRSQNFPPKCIRHPHEN